MADIIEQRVTPNTPRVIDNQEVKVYTPTARGNQRGVASYNSRDFNIDNKGMVSLKQPLNLQRKNADPLVNPEKMAPITEPGHENDNPVSLIKLLDIEFEHILPGEYGYDPRSNSGVVRLNRKELSKESFDKPSLVMLNQEDFVQIVTNQGYQSKVRWPIYPMDDTTQDIVNDTSRKLGFVMNHKYFELNGKTLKPRLPIASENSEVLAEENGYGLVRISNNFDKPWLQFTPRAEDGRKDLTFNENLLLETIKSDNQKIPISPVYGDEQYLDGYIITDANDPEGLRKLAYTGNFVKPGVTIISEVDGLEYSNGVQLPYGEPYDPETMVQRTMLLLTKASIGLAKIPNLDPKEWEVSNNVRYLINILQSGEGSNNVIGLTKKKDANEYDTDIGTKYEVSNNPTTVKQRIANLEAKVGELDHLSYGFIGYATLPSDSNIATQLNELYPTTTPGFGNLTHIFVTNTNTLWGWSPTKWVDTNLNVIQGDEFQYKIGNNLKTLEIVSQDSYENQTDFLMEFDNNLLNLKVNVPYVAESKYIHNWLGQLKKGSETFLRGTTTNGLYKKLWFGSTEDYQKEFITTPDDSIVTIITDDSSQFGGNVVDEVMLEARLDTLVSDLLANTTPGNTYLLKPTIEGWDVEVLDVSQLLTLTIKPDPEVTNIKGIGNQDSGILRYNAMDFALIHPTLETRDPILNINYKGIRETQAGLLNTVALGREGNNGGAYLVLSDLQTSMGEATNNKALIKWLIDTQYIVTNYPYWEEGKPGSVTSDTLQSSINKLWSTIINIDTRNITQNTNIGNLTTKLNKYPDAILGSNNSGNYVLTVGADDDDTNMILTNLKTLIGEHPLSEQVNINSWTHGTGQDLVQPQPMSGNSFAQMFSEASKVKYLDAINDELKEMLFWVGNKALYDELKAGNKLSDRTLYICLDGYLYFGSNLISKTGVSDVDISNIVANMTASQVQNLLNKLGTV